MDAWFVFQSKLLGRHTISWRDVIIGLAFGRPKAILLSAVTPM